LCYAWEKDIEHRDTGVITFEDGIKILYSNTANGDGEYPVYPGRNGKSVHNNTTGVDAGMIAVISVEDVQKLNPEFDVNDKWYPRINDFNGTIQADENGNFIGDLEVDTHNSIDEEPYNDEDNYE